MSYKQKRKEISEPDQFIKTSTEYWSVAAANKKLIISVACGLLALAIVVIVLSNMSKAKIQASGEALAAALTLAERPIKGVRAEIKNPDRILLPGQFTKVKVLLDIRENAKVVPLKAVDIDKGGAYIYVMRKDSTVERRFIEIGPEFDNYVVVERGLSVGEFIVTEGYHKLNPGDKVNFYSNY